MDGNLNAFYFPTTAEKKVFSTNDDFICLMENITAGIFRKC